MWSGRSLDSWNPGWAAFERSVETAVSRARRQQKWYQGRDGRPGFNIPCGPIPRWVTFDVEVKMSEFDFAQVQDFLVSLVPEREPELRAMEEYARKTNFNIIGPAAGYVCYQVARLMGARSVFELGSGYGYSTAWFAKAVKENGGGIVHHVVWDENLSKMAREHLSALGFGDILNYHVAEAVETLKHVTGPMDLIFNDIDKKGYPASLPIIKQKLRRGGVLIIDNILWHGRIFDTTDHSPDTDGVRAATDLLVQDPDWIVTLTPVRDGMIIAYLK
jgi:caffeoyl-CoA O-methyltransferase